MDSTQRVVVPCPPARDGGPHQGSAERALSRVEFTWDPVCASLKSSAEASYRAGFMRARPALAGIYSLSLLNEVLQARNLTPVQGPTPQQ